MLTFKCFNSMSDYYKSVVDNSTYGEEEQHLGVLDTGGNH